VEEDPVQMIKQMNLNSKPFNPFAKKSEYDDNQSFQEDEYDTVKNVMGQTPDEYEEWTPLKIMLAQKLHKLSTLSII